MARLCFHLVSLVMTVLDLLLTAVIIWVLVKSGVRL